MIEYLEVRRKSDREIIGIIDSAKSIIWHSTYYGVGDFEIYAVADSKHVELLQEGNWITRPDDLSENGKTIGIIEKIESSTSIDDGKMIIASGRFAKSILDRRHIYRLSGKTNKATILSGKVETAIRTVIQNNAINCSFDATRNIPILQLGALANIPTVIVDELGQAAEKQVSYQNLLEYTEEVLKEYKMASNVTLIDSNYKLQYFIYKGKDRSVDNTEGNEPIIFSQDYDNLAESTYSMNVATKKTAALIGGEGEGLDRFYSLVPGTETGFERREMWVDASSLSKTYEDEGGTQHTYSDTQYRKMLKTLGKQELSVAVAEEAFEASINSRGGIWKLNEHYSLGDIVTFQDNSMSKYANVRITELTEVQDENGYAITPVFDFESGDAEIVETMVALSSENGRILMTETGFAIQPELASLQSASGSNADIQGVKISELPESTDVYDGCCMPIVTNGETKKIYFSMLKEKIEADIDVQAITASRIDEICV